MREQVDFTPSIGDKVKLPYPTGGRYYATIDEIDNPTGDAPVEQCIFRGYW